jgi:hypothetical protein
MGGRLAHYRLMKREPQASAYRPDPEIAANCDWIGDPVRSAEFPQHIFGFRNGRWARVSGQ